MDYGDLIISKLAVAKSRGQKATKQGGHHDDDCTQSTSKGNKTPRQYVVTVGVFLHVVLAHLITPL